VERAAALIGTGVRVGVVLKQPRDGRRTFVLRGVHKRLVKDLLREVTCWQREQRASGARLGMHELGFCVEQLPEEDYVTGADRGHRRGHGLRLLARAPPPLRFVAQPSASPRQVGKPYSRLVRFGSANASHGPFGLLGLAFDVSTESGPGGLAMLSRNRSLGVGEPQLIRQVGERLLQTTDRVSPPGACSAEQILRGLAVVLHLLNDGQAVMDFAWCLGHDSQLRSPASAFGLERASGNRAGTHCFEMGTSPSGEHPSPRTGGRPRSPY
jgi:hypothetical protein